MHEIDLKDPVVKAVNASAALQGNGFGDWSGLVAAAPPPPPPPPPAPSGITRTGGSGNDRLTGGGGHDVLHGGGGHDTLRGGGGNDVLNGGAGRDDLQGGSGEDVLNGGSGRDRLQGGTGRDVLTGGADADIFFYAAVAESRPGAASRDVITDFQRGQDRIDLGAIDTDPHRRGDQDFVWIGQRAFGGGDEVRFQRQDGGILVQADIDGDRRADFEIFLYGLRSLSASDLDL